MSIASRVKAFEEAAAASQSYQKPANLSPRTSLTFSSDDALTAASSSAPASPRANSVLEDLDSFVLTGPPSASPSPTSFSASKPTLSRPAIKKPGTPPATLPYPLISLVSPPRTKMPVSAAQKEPGIMTGPAAMTPPLPPRRQQSNSSLRASFSSSKPVSNSFISSDSLTIDQPFTIISPSRSSGHAHASSASSFHSLSLSDGGDKDTSRSKSVSPAVTGGSDSTTDWPNGVPPRAPHTLQVTRKAPPPVPDRPSRQVSNNSMASTNSSISSHAPPIPAKPGAGLTLVNTPYQVRRQAPAPPPRPTSAAKLDHTNMTHRKPPPPPLLDLSSSTTSTISPHTSPPSHATRRRSPVPLPARLRYEELFDKQRNLLSSSTSLVPPPLPARPQRTHVGWRGTSIDLRTTSPAASISSSEKSKEDGQGLPGHVVRRIWVLSRLEKKVLRDIWAECDSGRTGSLDREAFVQGMWRIDEELTKKSATSSQKGTFAQPLNPQVPYAVRR